MSRWFLDDDAGAASSERTEPLDDGWFGGRRGTAADRDQPGARLRHLRDDPAGRRSLTGYELRHRRSR